MRSSLVLPDLHFPFHHPASLDFLADLRRQYRPKVVVCIGDLGDQHGWSRHDRLPDAPGQAEEYRLTLAACRDLYKLFPRVLACVGNHDTRLAMKALRAGIPSSLHRTVATIYESPRGWQWADAHTVDGVAYEHGHHYKGKGAALAAARDNRMPTVVGHFHATAGVEYSASRVNTIWGLSVGCLVDAGSPGMAYAKQTAGKPVLGAGVVVDGVPMFVPMRGR